MDIADLLSPDGIVLRGGASSKRQALHAVAEAFASATGMEAERTFEALLEREALGSTGLGLAIVSAVVEAHGGTASVESSPGHTLFRILLPGPPN